MRITQLGLQLAAFFLLLSWASATLAQDKPNIILIVSDDTGWGDLGCYGGGVGRGMPTPNLDSMARQGMQFWSFYGQPSCTPGRAAMITGRIPNRSGMTTVAFQGQGGGLPKAEWTLGSVLKQADYKTAFYGKWHLGEADYALPNAHGYDVMKNTILYHLSAYTCAMDNWNKEMPAELKDYYKKVTLGVLEGNAGEKAKEVAKVTEENIGELDMAMTDQAVKDLGEYSHAGKPFFMHVNFAKNHNPNIPSKQFEGKSPGKWPYADCVMELDHNIGRILDQVRKLGIEKNTFIFYTVDNGAWQDVAPDAGYTPFRGSKGTVREGGNRVPALALWPGKIKPGSDSHEIVGGLDLMATCASLAGVELPKKDRAGEPTIFDSYDMSPLLFGKGKWGRDTWHYFTETELSPGAIRVGRYKFVFNLRGDNGAVAGAPDSAPQMGWTGAEKYVAGLPDVYDLMQDPQERTNVFMRPNRDVTWVAPLMQSKLTEIGKSYVQYPPRPMQSLIYTGPMTIERFRTIEHVKQLLKRKHIDLPELNADE